MLGRPSVTKPDERPTTGNNCQSVNKRCEFRAFPAVAAAAQFEGCPLHPFVDRMLQINKVTPEVNVLLFRIGTDRLRALEREGTAVSATKTGCRGGSVIHQSSRRPVLSEIDLGTR
jgi:hypothetical protein